MSRQFDGVDDYLKLAIGAGSAATPACSLVVLFKVLDDAAAATEEVVASVTGSDQESEIWMAAPRSGSSLFAEGQTNFVFGHSNGVKVLIADGWQMLGLTYAGGGAPLRGHWWKENASEFLAPGEFSHYNFNGGSGDPETLAGGNVYFGNSSTLSSHFWGGRIAVAGLWDEALSDANFQALVANKTTQDWFDLAPVGLWEFNQSAVTDPVLDVMGGGADQVARLGTSVSADDPPDWEYITGGVPASSTPSRAMLGAGV